MLSAGFRPFFFLAGLWSALAVPLWLFAYTGVANPPTALPTVVWHVHEMVFGFGFASVAGFLLTAIPNWTGRLPVRGLPLALLSLLWIAGRAAVLLSAWTGPFAAALIDLAFPAALILVVTRELIAGGNWRNLPMIAALALLFTGNLLVHLHANGMTYTAPLGNRMGMATLLMLIALVGGRIIPSFTGNWLNKHRPQGAKPRQGGWPDRIALGATLAALVNMAAAPQSAATSWLALVSGIALAVRLARWRGLATLSEPLLFVLHAGYGWLALGMLLLGLHGLVPAIPAASALHALGVGAIGTMTLAVMTRATLGHSGRALTAGPATVAAFLLVTLAALLRIVAPLAGEAALAFTAAAGVAWSGAFFVFTAAYAGILLKSRVPAAKRGPHMIQIKSIPK
jgi:uncharacterized protein involved in response to NO